MLNRGEAALECAEPGLAEEKAAPGHRTPKHERKSFTTASLEEEERRQRRCVGVCGCGSVWGKQE